MALIFLVRSWPKKMIAASSDPPPGKVTLIVPCRNESSNIQVLLEGLTAQLPYLEEVILVDDGSEDDTFAQLIEGAKADLKFVVLKNTGLGKKKAINDAILLAKGDLIITSDADCVWPKGWVQDLVAVFVNPKIQLVAGPVLPFKKNLQRGFFELIDWASILLVTQYSFAKKKPLMCSGANLAYRKSAFESVNGYEGNFGILSGDDEFLLKKIVKTFSSESVFYQNTASSLVRTVAQPSLQALINQRVRWAAKWKMHEGWSHSISAIAAFAIQIFWLSSLALLFQNLSGLFFFIMIWVLKVGVEIGVLGKVLHFYGIKSSVKSFAFTSFLHPVFVIRVALGALVGKFEWKGRSTPRNSIFA